MKIGSIAMFTDLFITITPGMHTLCSPYPEFFPPAKTIGTVVDVQHIRGCKVFVVKWPSGSISTGSYSICAPQCMLELSSNY